VEDADIVLWTLLSATSSLTLLVSCVIAAKAMHSGPIGYGVSALGGAVLAIANTWLLESIVRTVSTKWLGVVYVAAAAWIPVAAFVGDRLTSTALHLF
jgi:hypothetical protein